MRVEIAGGGLAGSLLAIYLARQGHEVEVFERRGDMRREAAVRGRSINMALSTRGLHALGEVGLRDAVLDRAIPMGGRMMHGRDGTLTFQPYSARTGECIYSISRNGLNVALLDAAEKLGVRVRFHQKVVGVDLERGTLVVEGDQPHPGPAVAIGADGAHSAVRSTLQKLDRFDYRQDFLDWGYKELTLPAGPGTTWALDKNALHIWPRHDYMLIALPNLDGSFTCTLFLPFEGPGSFEALAEDAAVLGFFGREFADAVPLMPDLLDDFRHNPTSSLIYVRCFPWHVTDKVVLVGDACHAVVPFYGQGMNAAFEDCAVLAAEMAATGQTSEALRRYENARKDDTDALADLALANFVEMRSKVASRGWLLRDRLEKALGLLLPGLFMPLYGMVTFTRIPYAEARRRAARQHSLLAAVLTAAGLLALAMVALLSVTWLGRPGPP